MKDLTEKLIEAFGSIAWHQGYDEWLLNMADEMEAHDIDRSWYSNPLPTQEWNTDKHALWMLLAGMFGDWGTSIRSGWIMDTEGAVEFIRAATKDTVTDGLIAKGADGKWKYTD